MSMQDTFKSKRPHHVSRQGHDPHIAVVRPTINSDDPPSQSQPAEAAIKFVAENKGYVQLMPMRCIYMFIIIILKFIELHLQVYLYFKSMYSYLSCFSTKYVLERV